MKGTITRWLRIGFPPAPEPIETICITGTASQIGALRKGIGTLPGLTEGNPPEMQLVIAWSAIRKAMEEAGLTVDETSDAKGTP